MGTRRAGAWGGDERGQSLHWSTNTVDRLNQYTSRTVPAYLAVSGEAATNATVTLWWGTNEWASVVRQGRYWYGEAAVNNRTGGVWVMVTNLGVVRGNPDRVQSEVRSDFVAQSPEALVYDGDGNLVRDGRWMYSWDAENRLVRVMSYGATDRASWRRVDWAYDALGRRTRQTTYVLSNGVWVVTEDLKFVSDPVLFGRHIAEWNATNHALVRSYVWGLDLSETLDGAGGVGGLLWVRLASGPAAGTHFVTYDGNGNVWQLVSASTGTETARYEYGPFAEPLRTTGPAAPSNPFRFSTKRTDPATGLALYEYRAYDPSRGRWFSGGPMENVESLNSYNAIRDLLADYEGRDGQKPRKPRPPNLPNPLKRVANCAAECAAKHGLEKIGKWIHAQFYCGKLADECLDKEGLPSIQDVFTGDMGVGRELWNKFLGCFTECMGGSNYGIAAQVGPGKFACSEKSRRVDWELKLLLTVIINGKHYIVHEEKVNGSCGTRAYMICCVICR